MNAVATVATVATVVAVQALATTLAVAPHLSARLRGEEIHLRVAPVDPIDPFRGAYVRLDYPDLQRTWLPDRPDQPVPGDPGDVYVTLAERGGTVRATGWSRERPDGGLYLACSDRAWRLECGIESWFVPQDEARALEDAVTEGDVVATVRVDDRGNAALVGLETGR